MALKGVIQGQGAAAGGQLSGSGVTSVALTGPPEFVISGSPITGAGTLDFQFVSPTLVAHGGTGMGSFAANSILQAGLTSTGPFQSITLNNLTSNFLRGDGVFAAPPAGGGGGAGTVTSVDMTTPPEFVVSGNPITAAGTLALARISPSSVSAGGTGIGAFTSNALIQAGLSSTGSFRSLPLNQQTSTFLDGTGTFRSIPFPPPNPGTVTSVDLSPPPGFAISGNPITGAGTLNLARIAPDSVAFGGTGAGAFTSNALVQAGLSSTGAFRSLPLNQQTSTFLDGTGTFRSIPFPPAGAGTVTSVDLSMSSEFRISGNPVTGAGVLTAGFIQPVNVAHGGTGLGSVGIGAIVRGGLSSTAPFQGTPLTNLTSNFLDGTGNFSVPPSGGGGGAGTVTSVGLQLTSEFNITGSPVTASGNLMASFAFQSANFGFFGPSAGVPATPAFRQMVNADVPQSLSGKTLTSSTFQNPTIKVQQLTFGSSIQWNMNSGNIALLGQTSTTTGMMDTPANLPNGGSAILRVMQLGTGLPPLAFNAAWKFELGVDPTLSSGFSKVDVISLYLESTAVYGVARKDFR